MTGDRPAETDIGGTAQSADAAATAYVPPWPLAVPGTARYRFQVVKRSVWALAVAHVALYDYVATYLLITQNDLVRAHWNNAFVHAAFGILFLGKILRHFVRNLGEAEAASATGWVFGADPFSPRKVKERHGYKLWFYRLFNPEWLFWLLAKMRIPTVRTYHYEQRFTWRQWLYGVFALPFAGFIGYAITIVAYFASLLVGVALAHFGIHPAWDTSHYPFFLGSEVDTFKENWRYTIGGLLGTLFYARLVFRPYVSELMQAFASLFASLTQWAERRNRPRLAWLFKAHTPYPDGYRAMFNLAYQVPDRKVSVFGVAVLIPVVVAGIAFLYPGFFIVTQVATHKHAFFLPGFGSGTGS